MSDQSNVNPPETGVSRDLLGPKAEWSRVIAHAWKNPEFMDRLQKNPKEAIESVQTELNLQQIPSKASFFPLPESIEGLEKLTEEELAQFLQENVGIFGVMQICCV